mgnify:CR=1 FL=1
MYSTDKSYEVIGKTIKAVKLFLESDYQVNRKGYKAYIRENAVELSDKPYIKDALCGFLNYLGIGYSRTRKEKYVKPLEKLSDVSEKNMKLMNEFVYYLTQDEDYSPHTIEIYHFQLRNISNTPTRYQLTITSVLYGCWRMRDCLPEQYAYVLPHLNVSANG